MTGRNGFLHFEIPQMRIILISKQWKGSEGGRGDVSRGNPVIFQKKGETTCMEH